MEDRTESDNTGMEGGSLLIVVGAFLHIVAEDFGTWHVGIVHVDFVAVYLEEHVVAFEHVLEVHTVGLCEVFFSIKLVLVGRNLARVEETEEEREKVHLVAASLNRIVEGGVLVLREVEFTIDIASPRHIVRHGNSRWIHEAGTADGLLLLLLTRSACVVRSDARLLRLCGKAQREKQ